MSVYDQNSCFSYLEVFGDLLEGEEDRLVLPLLEHVHQILDLLVPPVKLKVKVNKKSG